MHRFLIVFLFISIFITVNTSFISSPADSELPDPDIYSRKMVEYLRTKDSVGLIKGLGITKVEFTALTDQFRASSKVSPEIKQELPDSAGVTFLVNGFADQFRQSYASIQEYFKTNGVDVSTLSFDCSFFKIRRRRQEAIATNMDVTIRVRDGKQRYFLIKMNEVLLLNSQWKGGVLSEIQEVNPYNDPIENDYYDENGQPEVSVDSVAAVSPDYSYETAVPDSASVQEYADAEVVVDTVADMGYYDDTAPVITKKQAKMYKKIQKLYDKANALE